MQKMAGQNEEFFENKFVNHAIREKLGNQIDENDVKELNKILHTKVNEEKEKQNKLASVLPIIREEF